MIIQTHDYNNASNVIAATLATEYRELERVLNALPLQLKASDQAGIQGRKIFDPVGTNEFIKHNLEALATNWISTVQIPATYQYLGRHIDFAKQALAVEVQFSNYPFLLNNAIRSELFFSNSVVFVNVPLECLVIVTKSRIFPASNSTLTFEQSQILLNELEAANIIRIPIRLVGLFETANTTVPAVFNQYENPRYSRILINAARGQCHITPGLTQRSPMNLRFY